MNQQNNNVNEIRVAESLSNARAGQSSYTEKDWSDRLGAFLHAQGEYGRITNIKRPSGGASAANIIFTLEGDTSTERYVARLQPEQSFMFADFNAIEQFNVQRALHNAGLQVPAALWLDAEGKFLGRPGYVMAFATGAASSSTYFTEGPLSNIPAEQRLRMMHNMTRTLVDFHRKAPKLEFMVQKVSDENWIEREIDLWFGLVDYAAPELTSLYEPIRDWLVDTAPNVPDPVLVHGDWQGGNMLWSGEEVSTILDFDAVHIGPRESDLASACTLDEAMARFFENFNFELPSMAQRAAWYEQYSGIKLTNLDYHFTRAAFQFACGVVSLSRNAAQDLAVEPTPIMDWANRRLIAMLPKSLPFQQKLPVRKL